MVILEFLNSDNANEFCRLWLGQPKLIIWRLNYIFSKFLNSNSLKKDTEKFGTSLK